MKSEQEILRQYLRANGLRRTPERERILQEIFAIHEHFDVDELYLRLRHKGVKVSKASIYRAVKLFLDCGLIREVDFSDGHWHFEHIYGHNHHSHLRCLSCGEIVEFEDAELRRIQDSLAQTHNYRIVSYHFEVKGYCPSCANTVADNL